ncbi:MarR family winged helix-turn-helix transcriptional regulator [Sinomonas terrae]|uniref:MarR family transcriptional regulator n=1 Tax=Sinomonas terrae TaxID=2908838 RepID=A0ABS9TWI6_9MICC|nr:MarR family transcriptional regulator [Sinomonas terrae]MCH6468786.1 MarR family transcriptional regulator [Sinomonas terrae]
MATKGLSTGGDAPPTSAASAQVAAELRGVLGRLNRRLRQQADVGDLTRSQLNLISRIERDGPATVSDLARAEGVRPQSMGATVAALEEAGYLRRDPDPGDRRKTAISLSDSAREQIAASRLVRQDWLQRALNRELTREELEQVRQTIGLLARIVGNT